MEKQEIEKATYEVSEIIEHADMLLVELGKNKGVDWEDITLLEIAKLIQRQLK